MISCKENKTKITTLGDWRGSWISFWISHVLSYLLDFRYLFKWLQSYEFTCWIYSHLFWWLKGSKGTRWISYLFRYLGNTCLMSYLFIIPVYFLGLICNWYNLPAELKNKTVLQYSIGIYKNQVQDMVLCWPHLLSLVCPKVPQLDPTESPLRPDKKKNTHSTSDIIKVQGHGCMLVTPFCAVCVN